MKKYLVLLLALLIAGPALASNMGFKLNKSLPFTAGKPNIHWISLPWFNSYTLASSICSDIANASSVTSYDPPTNSYTVYTCGDDLDDFTLVKGKAYGVNVSATTTAIVVGSHDDSFSVSLPFTAGKPNIHWISIPYHSTATLASTICAQNPKFSSITAYDPPTNGYTVFTCGDDLDDFTIVPGTGYGINVSATTTWSPSHY